MCAAGNMGRGVRIRRMLSRMEIFGQWHIQSAAANNIPAQEYFRCSTSASVDWEYRWRRTTAMAVTARTGKRGNEWHGMHRFHGAGIDEYQVLKV